MRRSDHTAPFDQQSDAESDLTQEFWGESDGWRPHGERSSRRVSRTDDTGSLQALRDGVAAFRPQRVDLRDPSGEVRRTRSHGRARAVAPTVSERRAAASIGDLAAGHFDDIHIDDIDERPSPDHDVALSPARPDRVGVGGADPLLVRLGALLLVGILLVPVALALRPADAVPDAVLIDEPGEAAAAAAVAAGAIAAVAAAAPLAATESAPAEAGTTPATQPSTSAADEGTVAGDETAAPAEVADTVDESSATTAADPTSGDESGISAGAAAPGDGLESGGIDAAATVDAAAERIVPECPQTYEAAAGDSWYRIAEAAGVTPSSLLAENRATRRHGHPPRRRHLPAGRRHHAGASHDRRPHDDDGTDHHCRNDDDGRHDHSVGVARPGCIGRRGQGRHPEHLPRERVGHGVHDRRS